MSYRTLRHVHLLCGLAALPFLVMYGVSAVQMAHSRWFSLAPRIEKSVVQLATGEADARRVARLLPYRGELRSVKPKDTGVAFELFLPGTLRRVEYDRSTGRAAVETRTATLLGVLNRLHHSAGFYHETGAMKAWAGAVLLVSLILLGLGGTGVWMWWQRREERRSGLVLLALNLSFALTILVLLRRYGP